MAKPRVLISVETMLIGRLVELCADQLGVKSLIVLSEKEALDACASEEFCLAVTTPRFLTLVTLMAAAKPTVPILLLSGDGDFAGFDANPNVHVMMLPCPSERLLGAIEDACIIREPGATAGPESGSHGTAT